MTPSCGRSKRYWSTDCGPPISAATRIPPKSAKPLPPRWHNVCTCFADWIHGRRARPLVACRRTRCARTDRIFYRTHRQLRGSGRFHHKPASNARVSKQGRAPNVTVPGMCAWRARRCTSGVERCCQYRRPVDYRRFVSLSARAGGLVRCACLVVTSVLPAW